MPRVTSRTCLTLLAALAAGGSSEAQSQSLPLAAWSGPVSPGFVAPSPLLGRSARLSDVVQDLDRIRARCKLLRLPDAHQRTAFRVALRQLLDGRLDRARWGLSELGFQLQWLHDSGQRLLVIRERPDHETRGWGFYVVNPRPLRLLVLEAPHPQHDIGTGIQAARLMVRLGARALLVATTHRCASTRPTRCQGRTGACRQAWGRGRYRASDRAHLTRTLFHTAHVELMDGNPRLVAVQIHGFFRRPMRRRHIIISSGTRLPGRRGSISRGLARAIRRELPRRRRRLVKSCNETSRQHYLCGTHNVQGRHTNGSARPCFRPARRASNRFLHVEQSMDARTAGGKMEPEVLARAMERLWPASHAKLAMDGDGHRNQRKNPQGRKP
jgi:hypothetical protein